MACYFNFLIKTEGLFKVVMQSRVEVIILWKQCKIETLLLQITK